MEVMVVSQGSRSAYLWDAAGKKMYEADFFPVPELGAVIDYTPPPAKPATAAPSPATAAPSSAVEPTAKAK